MNHELDADLILLPQDYVPQRAANRARMMPIRAARRARIGDQIVLAFENAETLRYQIQEMVMVEAVTSPAAIAEEVQAYTRFVPNRSRLTATLFIENDDLATVRAELERLTGIQHLISLEIRTEAGEGISVPGVEIPGADEDGFSEITHAVHFLGFDFDDSARMAFLNPDNTVWATVAHRRYAEAAQLPASVLAAVRGDLSN